MRRFLIVLCVLSSTALVAAQDANVTTSTKDQQIKTWVQQLGSTRFAIREIAVQRLIEAGPDVIDRLAIELTKTDVETGLRGMEVLRELAMRGDADATRAEAAIRTLAAGRVTTTSQRANEVLTSLQSLRTERGLKTLRGLGATISFVPTTPNERALGLGVVFLTLGNAWKGEPSDIALVDWLVDHKGVHVTFLGPQFDNVWLEAIAKTESVVSLQLNRTKMTDVGVRHITQMQKLTSVAIRYCELTDKCLPLIDEMAEKLTYFEVQGGDITLASFDRLAAKHPDWTTRFGRGGFLGIGGNGFLRNEIKGCIVMTVQPNQAAQIAGIREFDIITAYNGQAVSQFAPLPAGDINPNIDDEDEPLEKLPTLSELIGRNAPGDKVKITLLRGGVELEKEVVLGEWP